VVDRGLVLVGGFVGDVAAGVAVAVGFGEVAAGDFEPDAVSGEAVCGQHTERENTSATRRGQATLDRLAAIDDQGVSDDE
jgi:hypothetical protein